MTDLRESQVPAEPDPTVGASGRRSAGRWAVVAVVVVALVGLAVWSLLLRGGGGTPRITATSAVVGATSADAASAYLQLTNDGSGDARLVRVTSPASAVVTLHRTTEEGGLSIMESTDSFDLPAGATVTFRPGGSHLMFGGLSRPLRVGDTVELRLEFDGAPAQVVPLQVVPLADLAERVPR